MFKKFDPYRKDAPMGKVWCRFSTEPGIESRLIRWFTWSDWSHVDFVLANGKFLGARLDGGVRIRPHDYLTPSKYRYAYVEVADPRKVYGWATSQIGKKYDWRAIVGFLPRASWQDPGRWFCSELFAAAFEKKERPIVDRLASRITPQTAYESVRVVKIDGVPDFIREMGFNF